MAKGDVVLKFDAQTADYIQKIVAAKNAYEANADSARKMGDTVGAAGIKMDATFVHAAENAREMASAVGDSLGIVTTATGAATQAVEKMTDVLKKQHEEQERFAQQGKQRATTIAETLAKSNQQGSIDFVSSNIKWLSDQSYAGGQKFSEEELGRGFAGISDVMGKRISAGDKFIALNRFAQARAAGQQEAQATQTAITYARLRQDHAPGEDEDQSFKDAFNLGDVDEGTLRMISRFKDKRFGYQIAEAGALTDQGKRIVGELSNEANKEIDPKEHREVLLRLLAVKPENQAITHVDQSFRDEAAGLKLSLEEKKKLNQARHGADQFTEKDARDLALSSYGPGEDRIRAMLAQPEIAPPEMQEQVRKLSKSMAEMKQVDPAEATRQYLASTTTKPLTAAASVAAATAKREAEDAEMYQELDTQEKARRELFARKHEILRHVVPDYIQGLGRTTGEVRNRIGGAAGFVDIESGEEKGDPEHRKQVTQTLLGELGVAPVVAAIDRLHDTIKSQQAASPASVPRLAPDPANMPYYRGSNSSLIRDTPGQK